MLKNQNWKCALYLYLSVFAQFLSIGGIINKGVLPILIEAMIIMRGFNRRIRYYWAILFQIKTYIIIIREIISPRGWLNMRARSFFSYCIREIKIIFSITRVHVGNNFDLKRGNQFSHQNISKNMSALIDNWKYTDNIIVKSYPLWFGIETDLWIKNVVEIGRTSSSMSLKTFIFILHTQNNFLRECLFARWKLLLKSSWYVLASK